MAETQSRMAEALRHHQDGRLEQAALLYQQVLEAEPNHPDALHLLGMLALQNGQAAGATQLIGKAIALYGREASYHFHYGLALQTLGDMDGAVASYRRALVLRPNDADTYNNMGNALAAQGKLDDAVGCFRRALGITPGNAASHNNLGNVYWSQQNREQAETHYRRALALAPDYADAHTNLGNIHRDKGDLEQAVACYRTALALTPGNPIAHNSLGITLWDLGQRDEAMACYHQALTIDPNQVEALANLGIALWAQGSLEEAEAIYRRILQLRPNDPDLLNNFAALMMVRGDAAAAMESLRRSFSIKETRRARKMFVELVKQSSLSGGNDEIRAVMVRALTEPWDRPGGLSNASAALIKSGPLGPVIARANQAWPQRLGSEEFQGLPDDPLLLALLTSAPNTDIALERFLTMARARLLETAAAGGTGDLTFCSALAQQCFINEYVFACSDEESAAAAKLRDGLTADSPLLQLLAVACYFPLPALAGLEQRGEAALQAVATGQIREPAEEKRLSGLIPRLTPIADAVSRRVQDQYEENPYPRWVRVAAGAKDNITIFLSQKYPLAAFQRRTGREMKDFLVAGCGTGQHSISTALKFGDRQMLAVDLSVASLSYAQRKSQELGLTIEYGQADILELGNLGRQFDVIESIGVLHHMADPYEGWRALLALLRPGGFMWVGFYSAAARRNIAATRARLAGRGIGGSAAEIRRFRQELIDGNADGGFDSIVTSEDFFSISACRDLLFHTQEQGMTLEGIAGFLAEQKLTFVGFEINDAVLQVYRQRYPDDEAGTNLANWAMFEQENTTMFAGMYVFWIQKAL